MASRITHAPFGPITGWTSGNGRRLDRPVDQDYRPQRVQDMGSGGLSLPFGYDPVGSLTELRSANSNAVLSRYEYDGMGPASGSDQCHRHADAHLRLGCDR